jgi:hypothetical protein
MRSPARRRPIPRLDRDGGYAIFCGPTVRDGVTGKQFPAIHAMRQRGVIVDARWGRGGRDKPDGY